MAFLCFDQDTWPPETAKGRKVRFGCGSSPSCRKGTAGAQTMVAGVWREAVHTLVGQEAEREASCWPELCLQSLPLGAPIRVSHPQSHRLLNQCHHVRNIGPRHSLDSNYNSVWWSWWLCWKNNWAVHPKGEDKGVTVSGRDFEHTKTQHRRYLVILRNRNCPCRQMMRHQLPVNGGVTQRANSICLFFCGFNWVVHTQ